MPNMYDYLESNGHLTFEQSPFNEVDNLIFAWLSYVDLDGIFHEGTSMSIGDAREAFFQTHERIADKPDMKTYINPLLMATQMLDKLADTQRFRNLVLTNYVSKLNPEKNEQFAVVTILLDERLAYVAYRGTDHSLVGWKEDCYMSFTRVPAQNDALKYLNGLDVGDRQMIVGGHSKGGNLAVHAAMHCNDDKWQQIMHVYSNDGPGFIREMLDGVPAREIPRKVRSIIPQASVVGMLFRHVEPHKIVQATQFGLLQHNAMDWQVEGKEFMQAPSLNKSSVFFDQTVKDWMNALNQKQLKIFVDALFDALGSMGARTFEELGSGGIRTDLKVLQTLSSLDGETRHAVLHVLEKLFEVGFHMTRKTVTDAFRHRGELTKQSQT